MKLLALILALGLMTPIFAKSYTEDECKSLNGEWSVKKNGKGKCKLSREAKKIAKAKSRCEKAKGTYNLESNKCENVQCGDGKVWDETKNKCRKSKESSDKQVESCKELVGKVSEENQKFLTDAHKSCSGDKKDLKRTLKLLKTIDKCQGKDGKKLLEKSPGKLKCVKASKWVDFSKVKLVAVPLNDGQKKKCNKILEKMKKKATDGNVKAKHLEQLKKKQCLDYEVIQ